MMNRLRLAAIFFVCLAAAAFATLSLLRNIVLNPQRAWIISVGFDQLANASANGDPDETISSRADRARTEQRRWGCVLCEVLDWLQQDHCAKSKGT